LTEHATDKYIVSMTVRLPRTPGSDRDALYQVIREVRRLFHRLANATDRLHADFKVSAAQRAVLESLAEDGQRAVPGLARSKGVTRQHIQVIANELQSLGLIEAHANPAHQRSPLLNLTEAGSRTFSLMRSREAHLLEAVVKGLAVPRLTQVARTLRDIGDAVDERLGHAPASPRRR
jgi:DNA-binding MarR family transcriptional regulator